MRSLSGRVLGIAVILTSLVAGFGSAAQAAGAVGAAGKETSAVGAASASPARLNPGSPMSGEARALAAARSAGHPVAVPEDETATDTVSANPDGTLTLTEAASPVRALSGGRWRNLDPALHQVAGGRLAPAVTTAGLTLSGGGSGPMATLRAVGQAMAISFPVALPAPQVSGSTALYADVLPGVDLRVTAGAQGSVSDVLVVKDAAAAANPRLRQLVLAVQAPGLTLHAGKAGDITAVNGGGHVVFATPTPFMWDSAAAPATTPAATNPATGVRVDARSGLPLDSTATGPGVGAQAVPVGTAVRGGSIVLTPDRAMLTSPKTTFPVYIDPSFNPPSWGASRNEWATVNNGFPDQTYWKTSGLLQVGYNGWEPKLFTARSFVNFPVSSKIYGSSIITAQLNMTEEWSPSCSPRPVQAWMTGAISSSTTWSHQPAWNTQQDSQNVAHGYNSTCAPAGVGFDISNAMKSAANPGNKMTQVTFGLKAADESDEYGWKQFANTATISVQYNHPPNVPTGLSTSPVTSCTAANVVGDGDVHLDVPVSDPDGGTLGVTLSMWKVVSGSNVSFKGTPTNPQTFFTTSGQTADFTAHKADLEAAAAGAVTQFYWKAQVTDFNMTSASSQVCTFKFDPTRPGAPGVDVSGITTATIGQPVTIPVTPPQSGSLPASYEYQLNAGQPGNVKTNPDGTASIMVTPTRFANVLTVTSVSPAGNYGDRAVSDPFYAGPGAPQADSDLTGDGIADLVTSGGSGMAPGLWVASGRGDGTVVTQATDFGANGNGTAGDYLPKDFANSQVITGHFSGSQFQDALVYYPTGVDPAGDNAGQANILLGTGDGSANAGTSDNGGTSGGRTVTEQTISAGTLTDFNGDNPVQLANAGDTQGAGYAYPDLIGVSGDTTGDGWYLEYYPDQNGFGNYQQAIQLATTTPAGGSDWNNWQIATAQVPAGAAVAAGTAMYLRNPSTGALYLRTGLHYDATSGALSYASQYTIADGSAATWNRGAALSLDAADINGDGTPDLWTTSASGVTTAYLATAGAGTVTLAAQPAQTLLAATHTWPLNDSAASPSAATAADASGSPALPLTGSGGWSWNNGDTFDPDVALDGSSGSLATASAAVDPNSGGLTVSVWANPAALGGTVLSQDMSNTASFRLSATTGGNWQFCLAQSNVASPAVDCAAGGDALVGQWAQLTATYDPATTVVNLYEGTVNVGHTAHAKLSGIINGAFQVGDYKNGGSRTGWFNGQVSQVETWNRVIPPTEISSPAGYFHPVTETRILDTRNTGDSPVGAGATRAVQVTGTGGVPSSGVLAVAVNVTVVPTTGTTLTVYPDQTARPAISDLNDASGEVLANFKIVPPGPDGKIAVFNGSPGSTELVVDVTGYFTADSAAAGASTFTPMTPTRIVNTLAGLGAPKAQLGAAKPLAVQVGGANGIPSGITAVAIDAQGINPAADGWLEYYPDGTTRPNVSGVAFHQNATTAETEIVPVAANGKIDVYASAATDVVVDVEGYFTGDTSGEVFHSIGGTRIIDSRQHGGPIASGAVVKVSAGPAVVAQNPSLVLTYSAIGGSAAGWMVGYADGTSRGAGSTLDYDTSQVIDNLAITPSTDGTVDVYNVGGGGTTQLVVECTGYFSAS